MTGGASTNSGGGGAGGAQGGGAGSSGGGAGGTLEGGSGGTAAETCDGHLFCDDFESHALGTPPSAPWVISKTGSAASLVVDSIRSRSGEKSAHFRGTVSASDSVHMSLLGPPLFPVAGKTLFVRFLLFVDKYPGSKNETMHSRLVWIGYDDMVLNTSVEGYYQNDTKVYAMGTYNGIGFERLSSGYYRDTSQRLPKEPNVREWLCWELEVDNAGGPPPGVKGGAAITRLFREGVELELAVKGGENEIWGPVPFEMLNFSLFAYQTASEPADFWVDDVVVDTKRIGCPTP